MTVSAILKQKGKEVASVAPSTLVSELVATLAKRKIGAAVVKEEAGDQLLGIVSERDVVQCLAANGAGVLDMTAADLMTQAVQTAKPSTTVPEAMAMMTSGRFRHLPVVDGGRLVGIISIGDVVKARLEQQEQEVDSLKAYVAGAA